LKLSASNLISTAIGAISSSHTSTPGSSLHSPSIFSDSDDEMEEDDEVLDVVNLTGELERVPKSVLSASYHVRSTFTSCCFIFIYSERLMVFCSILMIEF
jgi:hypothetical protein